MKYITFFLMACALAAWLVALINGIRMFGMLSGRLPPSAMLFRGIEWFNAANFKPEAAAARRMFVRGFLAFFVCILAIVLVAILGAPRYG